MVECPVNWPEAEWPRKCQSSYCQLVFPGQMMLGIRPRTTIPLPLIGTNDDCLVIKTKVSRVGEMIMPEADRAVFQPRLWLPRSRHLRAFCNEDNGK